MPHPAAAAGANAKLRDLIQAARLLLRRRHLTKALNNAQIAEDFASRAREVPGLVLEARLLRAEILLVNAAYAHDDTLRARGWRVLEQVSADEQLGALQADSIAEWHYVTGRGHQLDGDADEAAARFAAALAIVPEGHPHTARFTLGLAEATVPCPPPTVAHEPLRAVDPQRAAEAIALAEASLGLAPEGLRRPALARLRLLQACEARRRGDLGHALDAAHQAREHAAGAGARETEAQAKFFIGRLSRARGNDVIALRLLYEAMDAADDMGHRPLLVDAHLEIGHVFATLADDREAAKYFTYAADDAGDSGRTEIIYAASHALGVAARRQGDFAEANVRLGAALQAANALEWPREQGIALGELAGVKYAEGQPELARHLAAEARRCAEVAGVDPAAKTVLVEARLAWDEGAYERCAELTRACQVGAAREGRDDLLAAALRLRSRAHEGLGDPRQALAAERTASDLAQRLLDQQRDRHLPDLNMRAALRQRDREIEKLTREADLKNALVAKTEEIERANRDLVQVNEELRQFAYVASHDLKEPLRQIGSYVGLIRRHYGHDVDARAEAFFGYVAEGVTRLNRLFDSLMHYTSVARLEVRVERVSLREVVAEVQREIASHLAAADARVLLADDLPHVYTSGRHLRHVVAAVLDNAVKFHRPGEPPVIYVSADEDPGAVALHVRDNGIGIDPAYAGKVFVLFQMLHAKSEYPGTGVGLAIAQKTVQRLGGRISFAPNPGDAPGTTFTVVLPRNGTESVEQPPELIGGLAE